MPEIVVTVSVQGLPSPIVRTGTIDDPTDPDAIDALVHTVAASAARRARKAAACPDMIDSGSRHAWPTNQRGPADETVTIPRAR